MTEKIKAILLNKSTNLCLSIISDFWYAGRLGQEKTDTLIHILLKPLLFYDKIYLHAKNLEQSKYGLLIDILNRIANTHGIPLDDILHTSNNEIIPVGGMINDLQTVIIFDD